MNPERKSALKAWIAAILWLILIAIESTDYFSSANTGRILYPILHFLTGVDPVRFEVWNYHIRKVGHVVGYFGLSILLFRAWRATLRRESLVNWTLRWASSAFWMTALVASLDEWHQTTIPSRTGNVRDVVLDSAAALTGQILLFCWCARRRHQASVGDTV